MAKPYPPSPYLSQGYAPIRMECDCDDLIVEGEIPADLNGSFYRIGPNPQFAPRGNYNPLNADGMIHAFHLREGRVSYRNRWVRTKQWTLERAAGRALFGTPGIPAESDESVAGMSTDGVANTHIIWHANRLLALEEGHAPFEIDPVTLETIGLYSFSGKLPRNMTAHPKIDPTSGEMIFFANFPTGRLTADLGFYIANKDGALIRSQIITGPSPALVHDFVVTTDYVIFAICPVTVSIKRAMKGLPLIAWEPEKETHVGVMPRIGNPEDTRWFSGPPCMVWHLMNAYNDGNQIVVDVCQQSVPVFPFADGTPTNYASAKQYLTRWKIDFGGAREFRAEGLTDVVCEYPRFDERRAGLSYRHGYVACEGGPGTDDIFQRGIGHFDHASGTMRIYSAGPRRAVAEPVFVPRSPDSAEGEGYLLTNIFDEECNASHLAIFDAQNIERGPIARAMLDHRVPVGFHASWRPA
jgi:carotenoid cleavage dioxygenase-like enzyme